jgi:hypothetical protein
VPIKGHTGLRLKIEPSGTKVFITHAKNPLGRNTAITIGKYPEYDLTSAKKRHLELFQAITQGRDFKLEAARAAQAQQRLTILQTPFIQLCRQRTDTIHAQGGMTNRTWELEHNTIQNIEKVIGKTPLLGLTEPLLGELRQAYSTQWASLDRVKKMVKKVYHGLDRFTQEALGFDLKHRAEIVFGSVQQRKRGDRYIPLDQLTRFWAGFITAPSKGVKKDAYLMMLLTAERKEAVLNLRWDQVHMDGHNPYIAFQSKSSNGQRNLNAVPITGFMGLLLSRLARNQTSPFVFPSLQRPQQSGVSDVRDLYQHIRLSTGLRHVSPHDLRRTLAQIGRDAMGLTAYADEHLLHSASHYAGSTGNYLEPNAAEFTQRRAETFRRTHAHLEDLILTHSKCLRQATGFKFIVQLDNEIITIAETSEDNKQISSALAKVASGEYIDIAIDRRPLTKEQIEKVRGIASNPLQVSQPDFSSEL